MYTANRGGTLPLALNLHEPQTIERLVCCGEWKPFDQSEEAELTSVLG